VETSNATSAHRFEEEIDLNAATITDGHPTSNPTFLFPRFFGTSEIKPTQRGGRRLTLRAWPRFPEMAADPVRQPMAFLQPPIPPRRLDILPGILVIHFVLLKWRRIYRPIVEDESTVRLKGGTRHCLYLCLAARFVA
jgi:hypothetical protein